MMLHLEHRGSKTDTSGIMNAQSTSAEIITPMYFPFAFHFIETCYGFNFVKGGEFNENWGGELCNAKARNARQGRV